MQKSSSILSFVNDLLIGHPDLTLRATNGDIYDEIFYQLAADTPDTTSISAPQLASLADPAKQILARIILDDDRKCYRLFLLMSDGETPGYVLLKVENDAHSYMADADGTVEIPLDDQVDPVKSVFNLHFPVLAGQATRPVGTEIFKTDDYSLFIDSNTGQLIIDLNFASDSPLNQIRSVVILDEHRKDGKFLQIPLRNGKAVIQKKEVDNLPLNFILSCYR